MSRRRLAAATVPALLLILAVSAGAETDVYANGVVRGRYLYNTDDDIEASISDTRVELDIGVGALTLGAVYRAYLLSDESYNPAGVTAASNEIKHRYAAFEHDDLFLRAGHFFATFGHGLTLRSHEEVDLEHDTVLDGALAEYDFGDLSLTALTGTATDDVEGSRYYQHVVSAARLSLPFTDHAEVAGSVVERAWTQMDDEINIPNDVAHREDVLLGSELSVWAGPLSVAAEFSGRDGENPVTGEDRIQGHALYASGTLDLDWVTLLGEFKDYDDFEHYLVNPPTAVREHLWTLMNRVTYESELNDERGFLVEGSGTLGDALFLTGGASETRNHDADLRHWEMFGQVDWTSGAVATASAAVSMSREYLFVVEAPSGKFDEHLSGAVSAEFGIGAEQTLELTVEAQRTEDVEASSHEDYVASAAYYTGFDLTLIATLERTTSENEVRDSWFIAEARKLLSDDFEVSLSAGTERGGKKCTGGVCYDEPEFEGVRLRFTKFF